MKTVAAILVSSLLFAGCTDLLLALLDQQHRAAQDRRTNAAALHRDGTADIYNRQILQEMQRQRPTPPPARYCQTARGVIYQC